MEGHDDIITCLDFDKPYGTLVTASMDNTLRAWDLNSYRCLGILDGHQGNGLLLYIYIKLIFKE